MLKLTKILGFALALCMVCTPLVQGGLAPPVPVQGAITVGTPSTNACDCNQLTVSNHNISGSNPLILVGVSLGDGANDKTVNSVKYNGISLTQLVEVAYSSNIRSEIWYLAPSLNPADGNYNVVVTIDDGSANKMTVGVITVTGVDQTTPIDTGTVQSNGGDSNNDTLTVASNAGDLVMDIVTSEAESITPEGSQAELWNLEVGGSGVSGNFGGASTKAGAASVNMKYTFNDSKPFAHIAFNINNGSGIVYSPPPPPTPPFRGSVIRRSRDIR